MKLRSLTQLECQVSLESNRRACLACPKDDVPYVVPIYYAYEDQQIYPFSLLGKKIDWMRSNPSVCVLVGIQQEKGVWKSVVAEGRYEELPSAEGSGQERGAGMEAPEPVSGLVGAGSLQVGAPSGVGPIRAHLLPDPCRELFRSGNDQLIELRHKRWRGRRRR